MEIFDKISVKFFLPLADVIELKEKLEVNLVRQQISLGRALVIFEQRIIGAISLYFSCPRRLLVHVNVLRVQQLVQILFLYLLKLRIAIFVSIFDLLKPFLSFLLGNLHIVHSTIVIPLDMLLKIVGQPPLRVLIVPQISQC
jgi:hypothetical protein